MARAATETTHEAETQTVTRPDGRTICYATYGPADGRPVLCCHGTPGARVFGELLAADARAAGVRLLVPDRPGYGRSDHDPDRTPTSTARDLRAVLDHSGVETADVVAFSGGACYALALAEADADRVASLTLVSGAVPPSLSAGRPRQLQLLSAMAERTPRLLGALLRGQRWLAGRQPSVVPAQYTNDDHSVSQEVTETVAAEFRTGLASRAGAVHESRRLAAEWPVDVDAVSVPVTVHHGSDDRNVPLAGAQALTERLPSGRLVVHEGADHLGALLACRGTLFE